MLPFHQSAGIEAGKALFSLGDGEQFVLNHLFAEFEIGQFCFLFLLFITNIRNENGIEKYIIVGLGALSKGNVVRKVHKMAQNGKNIGFSLVFIET